MKKVYIYETDDGGIFYKTKRDNRGFLCLGTINLDIKPEKKVVTKTEAVEHADFLANTLRYQIPRSATNIKITYDVEEI